MINALAFKGGGAAGTPADAHINFTNLVEHALENVISKFLFFMLFELLLVFEHSVSNLVGFLNECLFAIIIIALRLYFSCIKGKIVNLIKYQLTGKA